MTRNADATSDTRTPRTPYGRRLAHYVATLADLRNQLAELEGRDDEAAVTERRRLYAQLDDAYVAAGLLRRVDPVIRRLRRAERRAEAQREAS